MSTIPLCALACGPDREFGRVRGIGDVAVLAVLVNVEPEEHAFHGSSMIISKCADNMPTLSKPGRGREAKKMPTVHRKPGDTVGIISHFRRFLFREECHLPTERRENT